MTTLADIMASTTKQLEEAGVSEARCESEWIAACVLRTSRIGVLSRAQESIAPDQADRILSIASSRLTRKPLAYLLGYQAFRDFSLMVNPDVLVPRPETEELVEFVYAWLDGRSNVRAIDVGTGTGAIALCLAKHTAVATVMAIDCSEAALTVARANQITCHQPEKISWVCGDLLDPVIHLKQRADVIVANLPYIPTTDLETLDPEVLWEPKLALDGGPDGLVLIRKTIQQAPGVLLEGGSIFLEIGIGQAEVVRNLFENSRAWTDCRVFSDMQHIPRIVTAQRTNEWIS